VHGLLLALPRHARAASAPARGALPEGGHLPRDLDRLRRRGRRGRQPARRPLVVTEHGIYAREREMELSRATWIQDVSGMLGSATPSPLRRFWSHYFRMLSKIAYHRAEKVLTLSED